MSPSNTRALVTLCLLARGGLCTDSPDAGQAPKKVDSVQLWKDTVNFRKCTQPGSCTDGDHPGWLHVGQGMCANGWLKGIADASAAECRAACSADASCGTYCHGTSNGQWDCLMYTSECSAMVGMHQGDAMFGYSCFLRTSSDPKVTAADPPVRPTDSALTVPLDASACQTPMWVGGEEAGAASDDGGWWVCADLLESDRDRAGGKCSVYSFGIKDDWSFDETMSDKFGCDVHGFDPSPAGLESKAGFEKGSSRRHYHEWGLGSTDMTHHPGTVPFRWPGMDYLEAPNTNAWTLKSISSTMRALGDERVALLKIDVEGAEWFAMDDIISLVRQRKVAQLAIELHFDDKYSVERHETGGFIIMRTGKDYMDHIAIIQRMVDAGLVLVKWERGIDALFIVPQGMAGKASQAAEGSEYEGGGEDDACSAECEGALEACVDATAGGEDGKITPFGAYNFCLTAKLVTSGDCVLGCTAALPRPPFQKKKVTLAQLTAFYEQHDPPKAAKAARIMRQFSSAQLIWKLTEKYGANPVEHGVADEL